MEPTDNVSVTYGDRSYVMNLPNRDSDHVQGFISGHHGFYELDLLRHMATLLKPGDVVVDAGAYIGNHSIFLAGVCGGRVVAFEPNPESFSILEVNIELNELAERVTVHPMALGRRPARGEIEVPTLSNRGDSRVRLADGGAVAVVALDEVELPGPLRMMKIDVQGMEHDVLVGAERTIAEHRPVLYVETETKAELSNLLRTLGAWNYGTAAMFGGTPNFLCLPNEHPLSEVRAQLAMANHSLHTEIAAYGRRVAGLDRRSSEQERLLRRIEAELVGIKRQLLGTGSSTGASHAGTAKEKRRSPSQRAWGVARRQSSKLMRKLRNK